MTLVRCPKCRERIIQKSMDGKLRIRTNIVVFGEDGATVVCKGCGTDIPVDLVPGEVLQKAFLAKGPKLVLRKG